MTSLLFAAILTASTLASANLPPNGDYRFSAKTEAGKLIYTGTLTFGKWQKRGEGWFAEGNRTAKAHLPEEDLNPIAGKGKFEATFQNGAVGLNLHPRFHDFNTTLGGQWKKGKIKGEWGSSTFVGYKKKGSFELTPIKARK